MKSASFLLFAAAVLFGAASTLSAQAAESPLVSDLTVRVVETAEDGVESLVSRETINPGETIQYRLHYHNVSDGPLRQIRAVGQIPAETIFIENSASPASDFVIEYSLDGITFGVPPLTYDRLLEDGTIEEATATPDLYRALRWIIPVLAPGEEQELTYRVILR